MAEFAEITPEQFGDIYIRNRDKFVAVALSYVRDRNVAEDLVAEAFAKFWHNRGYIADVIQPEAYIMKSVKNACLNYMRDKLNRLRIVREYNDDKIKAMEAEIAFLSTEDLGFLFESEVSGIFKEVMEKCPELTREVFYASRYEGMTRIEIADRFGISESKVKREISKALDALRTALKDYL